MAVAPGPGHGPGRGRAGVRSPTGATQQAATRVVPGVRAVERPGCGGEWGLAPAGGQPVGSEGRTLGAKQARP